MCTYGINCPICNERLTDREETSCSTIGGDFKVKREIAWHCNKCGAEVKLNAKVRGIVCAR